MIVFVKKLISSLTHSTPTIVPVEFADGLLAFRCDRPLQFEAMTVTAKTDVGMLQGQVEVCSYDPSRQLYRGEVLDTARTLARWNIPARGTSRLSQSVRVSSPGLPNFFALTEDLSAGGLRLLTDTALAIGTVLEMSVDLDDPAIPSIRLTGEVRWSARKPDGSFHSGVSYVGIERGHYRTLERYINDRLAVQRRVHGSA